MAKTNRDKDLFSMMRAAGVRRKVAAEVSDALSRPLKSGEKAPKAVRRAVRHFSAIAAALEDRVSGNGSKPVAKPQRRAPARNGATQQKRTPARKPAAQAPRRATRRTQQSRGRDA